VKRKLLLAFLRCVPKTVSGALFLLAATLFLLDHHYGEMTAGALALAAGAILTGGSHAWRVDRRALPRDSQ
jgi:hypothetical protein